MRARIRKFAWKRKKDCLAGATMLATLVMTSGCSIMVDRPTSEMIEDMAGQERKVVTIVVDMPARQLADELMRFAKVCIGTSVETSGTIPTGSGGYMSTTYTFDQLMDRGTEPDGSEWLGLRIDGFAAHALAFGVLLRPLGAGKTEAKVFPADRRKTDEIKFLLEGGGLFCSWKRLNYPYD